MEEIIRALMEMIGFITVSVVIAVWMVNRPRARSTRLVPGQVNVLHELTRVWVGWVNTKNPRPTAHSGGEYRLGLVELSLAHRTSQAGGMEFTLLSTGVVAIEPLPESGLVRHSYLRPGYHQIFTQIGWKDLNDISRYTFAVRRFDDDLEAAEDWPDARHDEINSPQPPSRYKV